jgi:hypothetical protein
MSNRGLLVVIAVLLFGIFSVAFIQFREREKPLDVRVGESVNEAIEEVGDEIDDHTKSP